LKLLAVDFNVITKKERLTKAAPGKYTEIKWPIV